MRDLRALSRKRALMRMRLLMRDLRVLMRVMRALPMEVLKTPVAPIPVMNSWVMTLIVLCGTRDALCARRSVRRGSRDVNCVAVVVIAHRAVGSRIVEGIRSYATISRS